MKFYVERVMGKDFDWVNLNTSKKLWIGDFCYSEWFRKTRIKLIPGQIKKVEIDIKEIK